MRVLKRIARGNARPIECRAADSIYFIASVYGSRAGLETEDLRANKQEMADHFFLIGAAPRTRAPADLCSISVYLPTLS